MAEQKLTQQEIEEKFREDIDDLILIAKRLSPYCNTIDEFADMLELAKINDGQLRLILATVSQQGKK